MPATGRFGRDQSSSPSSSSDELELEFDELLELELEEPFESTVTGGQPTASREWQSSPPQVFGTAWLR